MPADIRKVIVTVEEVRREGGRPVDPPLRRAAAIAVLANPYAGSYQEDLSPLFDMGEELAALLADQAIAALGIAGERVRSYGKAAVVGTNGELEHCAALMHPKFGKPLRARIGGGKALIPSAAKCGGPGTAIDVPLHFKDDEWAFDYFDAMEVRVADAPAPDEIVLICAVTSAGRPHARVGQGRIL